VLSHVERNITANNFKSGTVSAFFGGFDIDLSRADIEGNEAVILADAFFGGGEIRIPETWHVVIEGSAFCGAFMDETRQRPPEGSTPAKRLIIRGTALFGGITIQN
jgi:predicted membrane protein